MNIKEIRDRARELTKGSCRVCPICDGRICAGEVPGMGGTGTGVSFSNNVKALAALRLNTRLIHNVHFPKTETEILGLQLSMPLMVGPIGGIAFNLSKAMEEEAYQEAITGGANDAGIVAGTPDAAPIEVMKIGLNQAKAVGGRIIPFIKPWEIDEIVQKLEMCVEAGVKVVACDLDSIGLITLRIMGRPAYAKDQALLARITETAHKLGLRFIIKGVMTPSDASGCLEAGADGIVVSNHGGRVMDCAPGTAEVLKGIAAGIKGRLAIFVDGGIRTGADILKMLSLGADCVMIGRPYSVAAIGGGREGVKLYTETLKSQLEQVMIMTGCPDVRQAGPHIIFDGK